LKFLVPILNGCEQANALIEDDLLAKDPIKRPSIQEGSKPAEMGTKSRIVGLRYYLLAKV
jgi:hypothetical protein